MHRPTEPSRHTRHAPPGGPPPETADPAVLAALLARHGWRRRGAAAGTYSRWTPPDATGARGRTSLLVPDSRAYPDSADLVAEALAALRHSPAPSARDVLIALHTPVDEIHWQRDASEPEAPAAAWAAQEQLRAGARALLLAAALTARGTAGYHGARHRRQAETALGRLLTGTAAGGRELTTFLPVGTGAAPGPDGRPVTTALLRALYAARDATDRQRATGAPDAFGPAVEAGVCQELTEAIGALVRGSEGIRITLHWAPAVGPPDGFAARPEPVAFAPADLPVLREAGARYIRDEPPVAVQLTGVVVRMRREDRGGPGTVRLRILAGADVPQVRATLDEDDYRIAGHAHLLGMPVRMSGRLESRGGFRRLVDARDVMPVRVDDGERDRLLKSLHENIDFFEEACGGE
ncbi:hypothetical protein [Streptomyces telluris]|uniref:Uncharacterized protein n=1 Tax=Streptomyces telluris TaxID=2720021 RepID=A0A9X2RMP2_9ACTN|nr:hypothetical protein [Streptomyces telluris]MCQ8772152.1 hypothetical protein [Streptomyces telluris]NJP81979.1 hypothetical protein [Streptomyces telluris]